MDDPLVRDLTRSENLPGAPESVELKASHASLVFLAGDSVYKVKRAKDYGFFDYRTLEARKHFCEEEVRLNRRTAPQVYRGVLPVYRDARGHSLTRPGEVVDHAVHMRRLPEERSALSLVRARRLRHEDLDEVARAVARFYAAAPACLPGAEDLERNIRENFEQVEPHVGRLVDRETFEETRRAQEAWLAAHRKLLTGRVPRDGHGDLRLEHVYLLPEGVTIIDCIEFLERFRVADPALDVAFLAMDLHHQGRPDLAEYFLGRFALESDDYGFYPLADGYISYRAWVRGKVSAFLAADPAVDRALAARKAEEARRYFDLARRSLKMARGARFVIGVGGLIGSGKSTLAGALSRRLAAAVVSADATRKGLAGLPHDAPGDRRLYASDFSRKVRSEILRRAEAVLASRRGVILDTTFMSRELRLEARARAEAGEARFLLVECRAPEQVVRERLRARKGGVSDAREWLYPAFAGRFEPVEELPPEQHLVADTTRAPEELAEEIARRVEGTPAAPVP